MFSHEGGDLRAGAVRVLGQEHRRRHRQAPRDLRRDAALPLRLQQPLFRHRKVPLRDPVGRCGDQRLPHGRDTDRHALRRRWVVWQRMLPREVLVRGFHAPAGGDLQALQLREPSRRPARALPPVQGRKVRPRQTLQGARTPASQHQPHPAPPPWHGPLRPMRRGVLLLGQEDRHCVTAHVAGILGIGPSWESVHFGNRSRVGSHPGNTPTVSNPTGCGRSPSRGVTAHLQGHLAHKKQHPP
mmetsp:Transcript_4576/g.10467  ORF Transcript_4576/g.10467 Transcript_4576/m.10467 type:complete len:242 (-) Transcript_4576:8-733(-)